MVDRNHHGSSCRDAVHGSAVGDRPCRKARVTARRHDRHGLCDRARVFGGRNPASAAPGIRSLRRHGVYVDADGAADGRLCVERRGALRPELRAAAVVGLGGVRRRSAGRRAVGRYHRGTAPDLGHCCHSGARRRRQPRPSAPGRPKDRSGDAARRERLAAQARLSRRHCRGSADPGQPCRLLHFRFHHLAAGWP
jgi:hypothetical protein